jgi:hypothetical protein
VTEVSAAGGEGTDGGPASAGGSGAVPDADDDRLGVGGGHKFVYEHSTKQARGRGPADPEWDLPTRSVVIIDESGMVDTALLHHYAQIATAKNWRTILVGDHRQLDPVDAGGMFAELVNDPDVATVELDALHRFDHDWEVEASLALRNDEHAAVGTYNDHGHLHGTPTKRPPSNRSLMRPSTESPTVETCW